MTLLSISIDRVREWVVVAAIRSVTDRVREWVDSDRSVENFRLQCIRFFTIDFFDRSRPCTCVSIVRDDQMHYCRYHDENHPPMEKVSHCFTNAGQIMNSVPPQGKSLSSFLMAKRMLSASMVKNLLMGRGRRNLGLSTTTRKIAITA